ncbi:MAG: TPR repeat containing exported protein; Putative periplasmic protein contains a protein prenylyltransferase domain [uncultured Sulfurovum sp.]|uniref:TPR repeat containing exported protein Putative periplasmic protein contains a protein prenylyltransferase domain n=1 Tax=uncultured Sulfurovum sp. TaxID=269237 RepID=A0A6S6T332_9BACT|nr:MAG: TPR repeat containing exported protein; Putative periplasmic protein contains a protein prenylyltransferase domain [uncultured Sulfurovum sp.]
MLSKNKIIFVGFMAMSFLLHAYEPSVYGAGDINSATPYGLTKTEQAVLENKKTLQMLYNKITEQQRKIDGLTTVIEGQNREILELKESLTSQQENSTLIDQNTTYSLLLEMGQTVDFINNTYVTKDELKKALAGSRSSSSLGSPIGSNSADIYRQGVQFFGKRSYSTAKVRFEQTVAQNYKPAASNYYLGEIAYYTHNYKDAVSYFKLSASLYDQASYMDVLFLHTAISLDKSGEKEQAQSFYQHVIDTYPNKKAASIARNRM